MMMIRMVIAIIVMPSLRFSSLSVYQITHSLTHTHTHAHTHTHIHTHTHTQKHARARLHP